VTASFIIREATSADLRDILKLETHITGLSEHREREIVDVAISTQDCLVCEDDSEAIIGYLVLSQKSFFGRDFVRLLEVSPRHRRVGVATALLDSACTRCTTESVFISTNQSNAVMRSLLERDGWTYSGSLTGIDDGDPEFVFWKHPDVAVP
jgi:ribosomal protein S18 acetylase RimI-like enzyme